MSSVQLRARPSRPHCPAGCLLAPHSSRPCCLSLSLCCPRALGRCLSSSGVTTLQSQQNWPGWGVIIRPANKAVSVNSAPRGCDARPSAAAGLSGVILSTFCLGSGAPFSPAHHLPDRCLQHCALSWHFPKSIPPQSSCFLVWEGKPDAGSLQWAQKGTGSDWQPGDCRGFGKLHHYLGH